MQIEGKKEMLGGKEKDLVSISNHILRYVGCITGCRGKAGDTKSEEGESNRRKLAENNSGEEQEAK